MSGLYRFRPANALLWSSRNLKWRSSHCPFVNFSACKYLHGYPIRTTVLAPSGSLLTRYNRLVLPSVQSVDYSRPISKNSNAKVADDRTQKALEDDEFKDLLKDFEKDFGVTQETLKILEDIKKEQERQEPEKGEKKKNHEEDKCSQTDIAGTVAAYKSMTKGRFKVFEDKDASVIYSFEEESQLDLDEDFFHVDQDSVETTVAMHARRGITGVYDIEELVAILKEENLMDIAVIQIPESYCYADYMVLANAKSPRHARAVMEFVVQFYKKKKHRQDPYVKIEGEKYGSWSALDMGNIVLHVFLDDARSCYDIESLWLLGGQFDTGGQVQQDEFTQIMQEELEFFNCLQSSDVSKSNNELTK